MADGTLKVGTITNSAGSGNITIGSGVTVNVNRPSFKVYGSADQTGLVLNTYNTMALNTAVWDTASGFNTSTYKYVVPEAGKYYLSLQFAVETSADVQITCLANIYNETQGRQEVSFQHISSVGHSSSAQPYIRTISGSSELAASDSLYCRVYVYAASGTLTINNGLANSNFSGYKIGA